MSLRLYGRSAQSAAIGYLPNGFPIYRIFGAEGEGGQGNGNSGNGNAGSGTENKDGGGAGASGSGNEGEDGKDGVGDGKKSYTAEEYAALEARMKAADRATAAANAKVTAAERKDMDAKTRAETERDEAKKLVEANIATVRKQAIQIEFLGSNKYTWNNPKAALRLLDLDEVEIDDDGKVTGLDKAIEALAKSDPYLLKTADAGDGENKNGQGKAPAGKSGATTKNKTTNDSKSEAEKRADLERKFPSLRGRISNTI